MTVENSSSTPERDRRASGPLGRLLCDLMEGTQPVGTTAVGIDAAPYDEISPDDLKAGGEAVQDLLAEIAQENKSSQT